MGELISQKTKINVIIFKNPIGDFNYGCKKKSYLSK